MRKLHESGYDVADNVLAALAGCGYWPTSGTRILDLGCGEGRLVHRFRDLGFDAYGFDVHDRVAYRDEADRQFFGFSDVEATDTSNRVLDADAFRIPFADDFFDVVISTSVLEHVMDLHPTFAECARVLKPTGLAYHLFPNRGALVESHIYVPLAGAFHPWWYLYLWALLGVRNEHQSGLTARQTADNNALYFRTGLSYRTRKAIAGVAGNYFSVVRFVDDLWYPGIQPSTFRRNRARAWRTAGSLGQKLRAVSKQRKLGSLVLQQKRIEPAASAND